MYKYNEIMSHITVDPEMKSRVMSAVSNAIKENPDGAAVVTDIPESPKAEAPAKKKAKKTPIAIISSIAAAILVLAGVMFVFKMMNNTKSAESTQRNHNKVDSWNYAAADTQPAEHGGDAEGTWDYDLEDEIDKAVDGNVAEDTTTGNDKTYSSNASDITLGDDIYTILPTRDKNDYSTGMGDERLDIISRTLPFDLKGTGKGTFSSDISMEVFFGEQSQKVLLLAAPEGTDIIKQFDPSNKTTGTDGTTPAGTQVKYYRIVFGNVTELGKDETSSDINAALYNRDGMTYLLVFSDPQTPETIAALVDVI
ncbi:MAG: hypothetical protein IKZ29_09195 [Clostridiales bacterium]|nr:hypothetical protein [Clostridiales bacterium]